MLFDPRQQRLRRIAAARQLARGIVAARCGRKPSGIVVGEQDGVPMLTDIRFDPQGLEPEVLSLINIGGAVGAARADGRQEQSLDLGPENKEAVRLAYKALAKYGFDEFDDLTEQVLLLKDPGVYRFFDNDGF